MDRFIDVESLIGLAREASAVKGDCGCLRYDLVGWGSWPVGLYEDSFIKIGTLAKYSPEDAIIEEYHPHGTTYWSPEAPIAPRYYPYNQSTLWQCGKCARLYLRHNDDGAYHVAPRIRRVQYGLVINAPHHSDGREVRAVAH
ncbi:hypothetical protein AO726_13240 [Pseudomonas sp. TTU2014-080ASC]|nr:hypothetical protein AO726_13240 [Pseudomonas sp. TTU2014-080ASC]